MQTNIHDLIVSKLSSSWSCVSRDPLQLTIHGMGVLLCKGLVEPENRIALTLDHRPPIKTQAWDLVAVQAEEKETNLYTFLGREVVKLGALAEHTHINLLGMAPQIKPILDSMRPTSLNVEYHYIEGTLEGTRQRLHETKILCGLTMRKSIS